MTFEKRVIGDCTLYRGDSLQLLQAGVFGKLGAIVSDPPYGIGFQHGGNDNGPLRCTSTRSNTASIIGDDQPFDPQPWINAAPTDGGTAEKSNEARLLLWGADHYMQRLPTGGSAGVGQTPRPWQ